MLRSSDTAQPIGPSAGTLRPDIVAGLTAAAVVLPKAMAYATVAGLPVSVGLYTAFVPTVVYGLLGTSRVLSVSSTTTLAILTAAELALVVPDGDPAKLLTATATLTALTGVLLILASALRLGFVANFISSPVLTGFKAGIGLVIVLDQIPKLLGIHFTKEGFFRDILSLLQHVPETSITTVLVGAIALVLLLFMERAWPHSPAPLAVVAGGIAASWLFGMSNHGVSVVGHIPQALPSLTLPHADLIRQLLPGAIGIALMSFTETIAAGRAFADQSDPPIRANRELIATGAANLSGAFFGAMPAGGGTSQTAVVRAVGGRTQKASFVTAAASAATMLVLAPLLGLLPQAVLAAIVIVYSVGLIQPAEFVSIRNVRKMEFRWAVAAFLGVLVFGTLQGIVVAIILSLVALSSQAANPRIHVIGRKRGGDVLRPVSPEHPNDETVEGLLILRPEGRLFFVNAQHVADTIRELVVLNKPRVLMLDLRAVFDIEYSALQMLIESERSLAERGIVLWLASLNADVLDYVRVSGFAERLGESRMFASVHAGIRHYQESAVPISGRSPPTPDAEAPSDET
ncbi:sulfate transporter [Rhizobium sp. AC44/96]|uniref:SulP family inorganic anion transporter n=1 Tax=Rhizobium sp. AC44/96 TaxID=1841654 RepID=UPI00080F8B17|nr:SulP family inorganic anion transporter [Rhizobium sp. AC44/96]OCJ14490.1 sulfate transporter [Rhizobium sp. AC44/96]